MVADGQFCSGIITVCNTVSHWVGAYTDRYQSKNAIHAIIRGMYYIRCLSGGKYISITISGMMEQSYFDIETLLTPKTLIAK